jgi:hypothetical protein
MKAIARELVRLARELAAYELRPIEDVEDYYERMLAEYKREVARGRVHENMGDKYVDKFNDFVGDVWEYPYADRMRITKLGNELARRTSIV